MLKSKWLCSFLFALFETSVLAGTQSNYASAERAVRGHAEHRGLSKETMPMGGTVIVKSPSLSPTFPPVLMSPSTSPVTTNDPTRAPSAAPSLLATTRLSSAPSLPKVAAPTASPSTGSSTISSSIVASLAPTPASQEEISQTAVSLMPFAVVVEQSDNFQLDTFHILLERYLLDGFIQDYPNAVLLNLTPTERRLNQNLRKLQSSTTKISYTGLVWFRNDTSNTVPSVSDVSLIQMARLNNYGAINEDVASSNIVVVGVEKTTEASSAPGVSTNNSNNNMVGVIGGAVGGAAILLVVLLAIWQWQTRRPRSGRFDADASSTALGKTHLDDEDHFGESDTKNICNQVSEEGHRDVVKPTLSEQTVDDIIDDVSDDPSKSSQPEQVLNIKAIQQDAAEESETKEKAANAAALAAAKRMSQSICRPIRVVDNTDSSYLPSKLEGKKRDSFSSAENNSAFLHTHSNDSMDDDYSLVASTTKRGPTVSPTSKWIPPVFTNVTKKQEEYSSDTESQFTYGNIGDIQSAIGLGANSILSGVSNPLANCYYSDFEATDDDLDEIMGPLWDKETGRSDSMTDETAQMSNRQQGDRSVAEVLKEISQSSPTSVFDTHRVAPNKLQRSESEESQPFDECVASPFDGVKKNILHTTDQSVGYKDLLDERINMSQPFDEVVDDSPDDFKEILELAKTSAKLPQYGSKVYHLSHSSSAISKQKYFGKQRKNGQTQNQDRHKNSNEANKVKQSRKDDESMVQSIEESLAQFLRNKRSEKEISRIRSG